MATIHDYEDGDKILMFLLKEDDIFPIEFSTKICEGIKKFYKFKSDQKKIDKTHADIREQMENNFRKERAELEEDMKNYQNEINLSVKMNLGKYLNKIYHVEKKKKDLPCDKRIK